MQYKHEITINAPRDKVIQMFDNPDNMAKWQPGFISFEPISGEPGQPGAKSRLKYDMNGRKIEMIETITTRNLPHEFSGTYEAKGVFNKISNKFEAVDANTTRWVAENEFEFGGFMKIMGALMPGAFKKQSFKFMELFKKFVETGQPSV